MISNEKILSIIIPMYNVEKYIETCIESLINQDFDNYEIIIIDNGSSDKSYEICKSYLSKNKNIKLISQESGEPGKARNIGLNNATGKYIGFVDSDDYIYPHMFKKMIDIAERDMADIVICDFDKYYEDENKFVTVKNSLKENVIYNKEEILEYYFTRELEAFAWNKIYKRELFSNIRFDEGIFYEDIYPTYRLIQKAKAIVKVDEPLYIYRQRKNNITSSYSDKKRTDLDSVVLRVSNDYRNSENFNDRLLEAFNISYMNLSLDLFIKKMNYSYKKIYKGFKEHYKNYCIPNLINVIFNRYISKEMKLRYLLFKFRIIPIIKSIRNKK